MRQEWIDDPNIPSRGTETVTQEQMIDSGCFNADHGLAWRGKCGQKCSDPFFGIRKLPLPS